MESSGKRVNINFHITPLVWRIITHGLVFTLGILIAKLLGAGPHC